MKSAAKEDGYNYVDFNDKVSIATSINTDNLPLNDFDVNFDSPCLDHRSTFSFKDMTMFDASKFDYTSTEGFVKGAVKYFTAKDINETSRGCLKD